jgi:hypothetical protein
LSALQVSRQKHAMLGTLRIRCSNTDIMHLPQNKLHGAHVDIKNCAAACCYIANLPLLLDVLAHAIVCCCPAAATQGH